MSRENVELVRYPLSVRATSRRNRRERLALRFSGVVALGGRAIQRLSPRSRLRQKLVRRAARLFLEAYNRKDVEAAYALYHPDCETIIPHQLVTVGAFEPTVRGSQARLSVQRRWHAEWGEFRIESTEVIDLGDRVLTLGHVRGSGLSSGAGIDSEWGVICTFAAGWIVREQVFLDHDDALQAVGLSE